MRRLIVTYILSAVFCTLMSAQSVYPVPQEVQTLVKKTLNLSKGVVLVDPKGIISDEDFFLNLRSKGVTLSVDCGAALAEQTGLKQVSGAYRLDINSKGVVVSAFDEKGVYYALQTLKQMIDSSDRMRVECCVVTDWPDSQYRGIVDGFYGESWSHELRLSMIELAASLKLDKYVYAPKTDPYVGSPDWYMPYPQGRAEQLKELMDACSRRGLEFVWCIRPDGDFSWSEDDCNLLLGKLEIMHFFGVRSFGIFLDGAPEPEAGEKAKQDLIDRINTDFIAKKKGLKPVLTETDIYYAPPVGGKSAELGLYGYAGKAWNQEAFDPEKSLDIAIAKIAPDVQQAYRTYALHSSVAPDAFGIEESGNINLIGINGYDAKDYDALMSEFSQIESASSLMSESSNAALYADLEPWLDEFTKLGARCRRILDCIRHFEEGDIPAFWSTYAANLMSVKDVESFRAHPSGTSRLHPYYEKMMTELAEAADLADKGRLGYEHFSQEDMEVYIAPDEAVLCHLILNNPEGREVIVRLSDAAGRYTAEFSVETSYFQFEMKDEAVKVEIMGDVDIFETVFVK